MVNFLIKAFWTIIGFFSKKKSVVIDNVPIDTQPISTSTTVITPQWIPKNPWDIQNPSTDWAIYPADLKLALIGEVRKICMAAGLSQSMTQDLICTIQGESGWNPFCENNRTFDYGLCQFSKRYYLVEYKMTPQYAKEHPLECAAIMAKNFPTRKTNWVAYSNGSYLYWKNYTDEQIAAFKR